MPLCARDFPGTSHSIRGRWSRFSQWVGSCAAPYNTEMTWRTEGKHHTRCGVESSGQVEVGRRAHERAVVWGRELSSDSGLFTCSAGLEPSSSTSPLPHLCLTIVTPPDTGGQDWQGAAMQRELLDAELKVTADVLRTSVDCLPLVSIGAPCFVSTELLHWGLTSPA